MRVTATRSAKQVSERFLTPGNPTGLTGLKTHQAPRPALINIYNSTLQALQSFPKESAYRTSVEAITKHRLSIIEAVKPEGHDAWLKRMEQKYPELVKGANAQGVSFAPLPQPDLQFDDRTVAWDATGSETTTYEGPIRPGEEKVEVGGVERAVATQRLDDAVIDIETEEQALEQLDKAYQGMVEGKGNTLEGPPADHPEVEPPLTAQQITELENKLSAGLIEEVIEVAKGELHLVGTMAENKVWEELVETEPEGQWSYFERVKHTKGTQAPPS